eukprot:7975006-Ditylum_brightwellii.AAC.1
MQHLKAAPYPCALSALRIGVLTNAHMQGAALFPWPSPCGGGWQGIAHMSPPYDLVESPKAVQHV